MLLKASTPCSILSQFIHHPHTRTISIVFNLPYRFPNTKSVPSKMTLPTVSSPPMGNNYIGFKEPVALYPITEYRNSGIESQIHRLLTPEKMALFGPPQFIHDGGREPTQEEVEEYGSQINRDLTPEEWLDSARHSSSWRISFQARTNSSIAHGSTIRDSSILCTLVM